MSYDLLLWKPGARTPGPDIHEIARGLSAESHAGVEPFEPSQVLADIAAAIPEFAGEEAGPTIFVNNDDRGSALYLTAALAFSAVARITPFLARIGGDRGLVVYDLQRGCDISSRGPRGFVLSGDRLGRLEDPIADTVHQALVQLFSSRKPAFVVLDHQDGSFAQVATDGADRRTVEWHEQRIGGDWHHFRLAAPTGQGGVPLSWTSAVFDAFHRADRRPPEMPWIDVTDEIRRGHADRR